MSEKINAGYTIQDTISIGKETYVLGYNPDNPLVPYVTWEASADLSYFTRGHYISDRESAVLDLFRRATYGLEVEGKSLTSQLLTEDDRKALHSEFRDEACLEDIGYNLGEALEQLDVDPALAETFMANPDFRNRAVHYYYNIDHSAENEALADSLRNLIEERFSYLLPQEYSATLKISPEEMDIMNDVLSLTAEEVAEKYGPFDAAESALSFYQDIKSRYGTATMWIGITPKETPDGKNTITLGLVPPDSRLDDSSYSVKLEGVSSLEQVFSMTDPQGRTWSVDLHADERLRRVGKQFVFSTDILGDNLCSLHNGEICTVERKLSKDENDSLLSGLMWKARFDDGVVLDVFDNELRLPYAKEIDIQLNPEQVKPTSSLEKVLDNAKQRADAAPNEEKPNDLQR